MGAGPVIVSFFTASSYYRDAAERLRQDCARVGLDHDISAFPVGENESWARICRKKVPFYLAMQKKHRRPILWLDVDTRLAKAPGFLIDAHCDLAGFLRGFSYVRDFDPAIVPRFFAPFALYFNYSPAGCAFLELMAELECNEVAEATDDYFLEEAWRRHCRQLLVTILPPELVGRSWPLNPPEIFGVGISGNVSRFRAQVKQHDQGFLGVSRQAAALALVGRRALLAGREIDALTYFRAAYEFAPDDPDLAARVQSLTATVSAPPVKPSHRASFGHVARAFGRRLFRSSGRG
jgi:hypothetical protein